jgi:predicted GH43/DUF377 family glycosyl hydrolase
MPRSTDARSLTEKGSVGGSWAEYFDQGTTARMISTQLTENKMQLTVNPIKWTKYSGNPVLSTNPGKFDSSGIRGNSVLYEDGVFKKWYAGYDGSNNRIGYAISYDGKSWIRQNSGNPVLSLGSSGSWDDWLVTDPAVIKDGSSYKMYYAGNDGANAKIGYATSTDGISWTRYANNPVLSFDGGGFDSNHVYCPGVIKDGSKYRMWFTGNNGAGLNGDNIGYATSDDGKAWTIQNGDNAVLARGANGAFDDSGTMCPAVARVGGQFLMYYSGYDGADHPIGAAVSTDGIAWTKLNNGVQVIDHGGAGAFDISHLLEHSFVMFDNRYYLWYSGGSTTSNGRIGLAIANELEPSGFAISEKITLPSNMTWNHLVVKKAEPAGTTLKITVVNSTTNKSIANFDNLTGPDINLSKLSGKSYKSIRLLAYFTGSGTTTPSLYMWGVSWNLTTAWRDSLLGSNQLSSVQDSTIRIWNGKGTLESNPLIWQKDTNNPEITYGSAGQWDNISLDSPSYLKYGGVHYLFYSGNDSSKDRIGYVNSTDLRTWVKYPSNPVLQPTPSDFDKDSSKDPDAIYIDRSNRIYYLGVWGSQTGICYAVTSNLNSWTKVNANPVVTPSGSSWDNHWLRDPDIYIMNGTDYMWYSGNVTGGGWRIGLAKSSDGISWIKPGSNMVLDVGTAGNFDDYSVRSPSVMYDKNRLLMFYQGSADVTGPGKIGLATSTDGTTWTRLNNGNPVLDLGGAGEWDHANLTSLDATYVNGNYEMFYSADAGNGKLRLGHATSAHFTQTTIVSEEILLPRNALWDKVIINKTEPSATYINVSVVNATSGADIPGYSAKTGTSIDISAIDWKVYPKLKIKATFESNGTDTPTLGDWAVNWTIAKVVQSKQIPDKSFPEEGTANGLYDLSQYFTHKRFSNRTLTYTIASETDPVHVKATIGVDGYHMDFNAPVVNWTGSSQYTIKVSDSYMNITSNKFNVTVTNVNDPPFWKKIPDKHMTEDIPVDNIVKLKDYVIDSDTSNDTCTYSFTNPDPINLTIALDANKNLDATPGDNYTGTVRITVRVSDGEYAANTSFDIIVDPVNDPPVWTPFGPIQMTEDIPVKDIVNLETKVRDVETVSSDLSYTVIEDQLAVDASISSDHELSITPVANYTGTTTLLLNVSDLQSTASLRVDVIVAPVNDPPVWLPIPTLTMKEDEKWKDLVDLETYVHDAETLSSDLKYNIESVSEPTAVVVLDHGHVNVTPKENYFGTFIVQVSASDGLLVSMTNITVVVQPVNDPPIITSKPGKTAVATEQYQYRVVATDVDGDILSYLLNSYILGMTMDTSTGLVQWTPTATQTGSFEVKLQVSDGRAVVTQNFFIDVTPKTSGGNNAPVITSQPPTDAVVGQKYTYAVEAVDADKDTLTYSLATQPSGMTIKTLTGAVDWVPQTGMEGKHPVVVAVSDGKVRVTQSYEIIVYRQGTVINHPPVISSTPVIKAIVGMDYKYSVVASDADGDTLHYYLSLGPNGMSIDGAQGQMTWTPAASDVGNHQVVVRVSDGKANASQAYILIVANANNAPSITSGPVKKATVGKPYKYQIMASDPDTTDKVIYGLSGGPPSMTVDPATGLVTWTPTGDDMGTKTVTIYVTDGIAQVNQTYEIEVTEKGKTGLDIANFPWWIIVVLCVVVVAGIAVGLSRRKGQREEGPGGPGPGVPVYGTVPAGQVTARRGGPGRTGAGPVHVREERPMIETPPEGAVAGGLGGFKVEETIDLDDMDVEEKAPKEKDTPGKGKDTKGPEKKKDAAKENREEKTTPAETPPKKKDTPEDDIINEILGKAGK